MGTGARDTDQVPASLLPVWLCTDDLTSLSFSYIYRKKRKNGAISKLLLAMTLQVPARNFCTFVKPLTIHSEGL